MGGTGEQSLDKFGVVIGGLLRLLLMMMILMGDGGGGGDLVNIRLELVQLTVKCAMLGLLKDWLH